MRIVIAPPVPALLPAYASLHDPVSALRAACTDAVGWLGADAPARVRSADDLGQRVGEHLLGETVRGAGGLLVMANGSACRSEKAPGYLDRRAAQYDDFVFQALAEGNSRALADLDLDLAGQLMSKGAGLLRDLADVRVHDVVVDHSDDSYGVSHWVIRWDCDERSRR